MTSRRGRRATALSTASERHSRSPTTATPYCRCTPHSVTAAPAAAAAANRETSIRPLRAQPRHRRPRTRSRPGGESAGRERRRCAATACRARRRRRRRRPFARRARGRARPAPGDVATDDRPRQAPDLRRRHRRQLDQAAWQPARPRPAAGRRGYIVAAPSQARIRPALHPQRARPRRHRCRRDGWNGCVDVRPTASRPRVDPTEPDTQETSPLRPCGAPRRKLDRLCCAPDRHPEHDR